MDQTLYRPRTVDAIEWRGETGTIRPTMAADIKIFQADFGARVALGYVIYSGDVRLPLGAGVTALPFTAL